MIRFLTNYQQKQLAEKKWDIVPTAKHLTLYPEDFVMDVDGWNQVCDQLCVSYDSPFVHVLFIGTKTNDK